MEGEILSDGVGEVTGWGRGFAVRMCNGAEFVGGRLSARHVTAELREMV